MGLLSRIALIFNAKATAAVNSAEDPREIFDYAYDQQRQQLVKVKGALVDVATSKQQLKQQAERLRARIPELTDQARRAVEAGREDLARISLQKKQTASVELITLDRQTGEVAEQERKLTLAEQQLSARVENFKTRRETQSARYTAAQAQVRINESLAGVGGELAELGMAVGRAEEKTERMIARATALDALIDSGTFAMPMGGGDSVEDELRRLAASRAVDEELATLKAQMKQAQPASTTPA
jgi:phage shock protein A